MIKLNKKNLALFATILFNWISRVFYIYDLKRQARKASLLCRSFILNQTRYRYWKEGEKDNKSCLLPI